MNAYVHCTLVFKIHLESVHFENFIITIFSIYAVLFINMYILFWNREIKALQEIEDNPYVSKFIQLLFYWLCSRASTMMYMYLKVSLFLE